MLHQAYSLIDRLAGDAYRLACSTSAPSITADTAWRDSSHSQAHALQEPTSSAGITWRDHPHC